MNDLAEDDYFGLITFDSSVFHSKRELVQASKENLDSAKTFARGIQDRGATDINEAVLEGARMLNVHPREGSASILILLTDGDPTSGGFNPPMTFDYLVDDSDEMFKVAVILATVSSSATTDVTVNGELDSVTNGGFSKIIIHFKAGQYLEVTTNEVNLQDGQTLRSITGEDPMSVGSDQEEQGSGHSIIILIHEKDGKEFLWPVLRQMPADSNTEGILGLNPAVYEEVQQTPSTKLKIKDQEIDVTRSSADDYSIAPPTAQECWLMSAEAALQRPLSSSHSFNTLNHFTSE